VPLIVEHPGGIPGQKALPEEWLAARQDLLAREKEATHAKDAVNAARSAGSATWV